MKIDRLMAITIYLLNHGKTSAQKLAEHFEVSPRTIMRDIDTLGQAGIPIQSTYGAEGGYQILDTYVMEKQPANSRDYHFIVTALKSLASAYTNKGIEQTLDKMKFLADAKPGIVSVDFGVAGENQEINGRIRLLEEAIRQRKQVRFTYTNQQNEVKERLVEPAGILYKWYGWYLIGYYEKYQDYCMFKLVRMEHIVITDKGNTREHSMWEEHIGEKNAEKIMTVRLLGKQKIKAKCKEYLNGAITKEYGNGDFEYLFTVPEGETFWYGFLLSLGDDVKIVEPKSLIERILKTCNRLLEEYEEKKDE